VIALAGAATVAGQGVGDHQRRGVFAVLGARTFDGTAETGRLLGRAHPSGQWLEWLV
jgi:hypothetical protein